MRMFKVSRPLIDPLLKQVAVEVENHPSPCPSLPALDLYRNVDRPLRRRLHQAGPDLVDVSPRDGQLIAHYRVSGESKDAFDVASPLGDRRRHRPKVFRGLSGDDGLVSTTSNSI